MRNIHVVSHTHWDREWYRPFQSFRLRLVHLIDGLLDLLENDPQFKYFMLDGQTIVLDDYLAVRPEKEAVLRAHIQAGRIIIGPWHILPDMFLVGPESHVRNLLKGDQTCSRFGPKMMVGYIPDPFGYPGQVPQILRGFGISTACLWRGLDDQLAEFWWQAPDGSRILMAYMRDGYANGASLPANDPALFSQGLAAAADALSSHSSCSDILVMFGNDHMEPPPNTAAAVAFADERLQDSHVLHSTLPAFIGALEQDIAVRNLSLPVVTGELRACKRMHLLPGVLSTRMWIKQRNHAGETLLTRWAEPFITFEFLAANPVTANLKEKPEILRQAWDLLMQNHPHDSICGCSIDQVHDEMKVRFDQVEQIGEELVSQSLDAVAANISTQHGSGDLSVVIFNPSSVSRRDVVNAVLDLPPGMDDFDLLEENGSALPFQRHGLGSREIINMEMDSKELQSAFGFITDGKITNMAVQGLTVTREGPLVEIEAIMLEDGEPNLAAWKAGRAKVDGFLADPTVKNYHVVARSSSATHIIFTSPEIPSLGYRTLYVRPRLAEKKTAMRLNPLVKFLMPLGRLPIFQKLTTHQRPNRPPFRIENEFFSIEMEKTGSLSLLDKRSGKRFSGLNTFQDGGDCGDEYNYAPPLVDEIRLPRFISASVINGSVQQTLVIKLQLKTSAGLSPDRTTRSNRLVDIPITTRVSLTDGVPRVDISTVIQNTACDHRLRVHFPAPFASEIGSYDGHFEVVERNIGLPAYDDSWIEQPRPEVPQRAFTDVSDMATGLMIANRGLPEVQVLKNTMGNAEIALTLIRSVGWLSRDDFSTRNGHAGPFMETPRAQMLGSWAYEYSIIPHSGDWRKSFREAYAFETPLRAVITRSHPGGLPPTVSFVDTAPDTFVVSAVKPAEDGHGWILRGYNITAEPQIATIKTWKTFAVVDQVNLAEEKQSVLKFDQDGCLVLPVGPHKIVSLRFRD